MEMDEKNAKCSGSSRFLAWLAKHNRTQSHLDDSNRVMGWASRPDPATEWIAGARTAKGRSKEAYGD